MVSDVTLSSTLTDAQQTQASSLQLAEDFSQFLQLLTTQLQNQDPLDPMDSTEFTNQLVQFTQVEQSINTNQKLDALVNTSLASIPSVALGYVGLDITYRSSDLNFDGATPVEVNYALSENAASSQINIVNEQGELVFSQTASNNAGLHNFTWDGTTNSGETAPPGTYNVRVDALDIDDNPIAISTAVTGRVHGIESQDGVVFLLVGERAVSLGNVINAIQPEPEQASAGTDTTEEDSA